MEGLEISEIKRRSLNEETRCDSQFFQKAYLEEDARRKHFPNVTIGEQSYVTDGPHGYHEIDHASPVAMLTAKSASDWFASREGADLISADTHKTNLRSSLAMNDLILSTRGTVGFCAIVEPEILPANIDQDVARIALLPGAEITPAYLLSYLNSRFGQDWMARNAAGMVQQGLSLSKVREIPIPKLSAVFQEEIAAIISGASRMRKDAAKFLSTAEGTLLAELGLDGWTPPEPISYQRSSKEVLTAGRWDSQYFEPRFSELESHIHRSGNSVSLANLLTKIKRGTQPDYAEEGVRVVNSKHVLRGEVEVETDNRFATVQTKGLLIKEGDVLINGTGVGTIGRTAPYLHSQDSIPDNHVTVLRPAKGSIDSVYLAVYLNSIAGRYQVDKWLRGSSGQIELYPNDIGQFLIWVAPRDVQHRVRKSVEEAYEAKRHALTLLRRAKRLVEIAIEDSEEAALAYLEDFSAWA